MNTEQSLSHGAWEPYESLKSLVQGITAAAAVPRHAPPASWHGGHDSTKHRSRTHRSSTESTVKEDPEARASVQSMLVTDTSYSRSSGQEKATAIVALCLLWFGLVFFLQPFKVKPKKQQ